MPRVLLLDYDGTLAPFRTERMKAEPYPGVRDILYDLQTQHPGRAAIISGRPIAELIALLGEDIAIDLWGAHGWEHRTPNGEIQHWSPDQRLAAQLETAADRMKTHVDPDRLDIKLGSVAIHVRGLSETDVRSIEQSVNAHWEPLTTDGQLHLRKFDGGWELRIDDRTKSTAVSDIRASFAPNTRFAYLGDNDTDEDAFAVLGPDDWGILVREIPRPSRAQFWLKPPDDLLRFLRAFTNA